MTTIIIILSIIIAVLLILLFGSWIVLAGRNLELLVYYRHAREFILSLGMYDQYNEYCERQIKKGGENMKKKLKYEKPVLVPLNDDMGHGQNCVTGDTAAGSCNIGPTASLNFHLTN